MTNLSLLSWAAHVPIHRSLIGTLAGFTAASTGASAGGTGAWAAQDNKLKLVITASQFKYGNVDFAWAGVRPKGVIQCCPAFYEGSTSKTDLLQRIQQQTPNAGTQADQQKTFEAIQSLSEGNFRRIVLADPLLRTYFFIYDQNFIYRINRDLGDNASVVVEQFKRAE